MSVTGVSIAVGKFVAGALTYYIGDEIIDRMQGPSEADAGSGLPILLRAASTGSGIYRARLDPRRRFRAESVGARIRTFISNIPEAVTSSSKMLQSGRKPAWVVGVWAVVAIASGLAAAIGFGLLANAPGDVIAFFDAFAAGAILTLVADDLLPAAHGESDKLVGLATAAGFAVAAFLTFFTG